MSWYTHAAGLTGFDLTTKSFGLLAGILYELAFMSFMVLLPA